MEVAEMRKFLDTDNSEKRFHPIPPSCPEWAVRHMFARRNNLPLTPECLHPKERCKAILDEHAAYVESQQGDREAARLQVEQLMQTL